MVQRNGIRERSGTALIADFAWTSWKRMPSASGASKVRTTGSLFPAGSAAAPFVPLRACSQRTNVRSHAGRTDQRCASSRGPASARQAQRSRTRAPDRPRRRSRPLISARHHPLQVGGARARRPIELEDQIAGAHAGALRRGCSSTTSITSTASRCARPARARGGNGRGPPAIPQVRAPHAAARISSRDDAAGGGVDRGRRGRARARAGRC